MSGDQRRDREKSEERFRASQGREGASSGSIRVTAASGSILVTAHDGEFEHPAHPRHYTIADAELPSSESRISVNDPALRAVQDSFNPVRVPPHTVRPQLSLWTRAWGTVAFVIVVAGAAVGIVAGMRGRTFGPAWRTAQKDRPAQNAAQPEAKTGAEGASTAAVPAAAPGHTAPPPAAPGHTAPPPVAPAPGTGRAPAPSALESGPPVVVRQEPSTASAASATSVRPLPRPVAYRTTESLAVSPPVTHPSGTPPSVPRRPKPVDSETRSSRRAPPRDEATESPTPSSAPDAPEPKGESEAWVTEERRF
jgi:hypothetical protein